MLCLSPSVPTMGQTFHTTGEGVTAGRFVLFPSIALEYERDNNVFYRSADVPGEDVIGSGILVVRPRLLVDLPIGMSRIRWVYSPVYRNYSSNEFEQTQRVNHFFDLEASRVGPALTVRLADHLVKGTIELQEVDRGGEAVFGLAPFTNHSPEMEVTLRLGANNGVSIVPRYTSVHFADQGDTSFFSYRRRELELRLNHQVSEPTMAYVFYALDATDQRRQQVLFGDVSLSAGTIGIGMRRSLNQEVVSAATIGYKQIDFKGGSKSDFAGLVLDATTTWQIGDVSVLSLTASHQAYQSFFVNNNYFVDSELRVRLTRQIGRSMYWDTSLSYMRNSYADPLDISVTPETPSDLDCLPEVPDPDNPGEFICGGDGRIDAYESYQSSVGLRRRDGLYRLSVGAGWQVAPTIRVFIGYNSDRRKSNMEQVISGQMFDPFNYNANQIVFRFEAGWL